MFNISLEEALFLSSFFTDPKGLEEDASSSGGLLHSMYRIFSSISSVSCSTNLCPLYVCLRACVCDHCCCTVIHSMCRFMYPQKMLSQHFWTEEQKAAFVTASTKSRKKDFENLLDSLKKSGTKEQLDTLSLIGNQVYICHVFPSTFSRLYAHFAKLTTYFFCCS